MKKNTTLKHKKGVQTIPQLRKSFDHIEQYTKWLVTTEKDKKKQVVAFKKEWKKVFHHDVETIAAQTLIDHHTKQKQQTRKNKKTKNQSGGEVPLSGAPIDFQTRPGTYQTPYGNFLEYIGSGFNFYDKINQDSFFPTQCGKENSTPVVYESTGSNKVGGSRKRSRKQRGGFPTLSEFAQALSFGPLSPTAPTTPLYDLQTATKAQPLPPSSAANTATPPYVSATPQTVSYPSYAINRQLTTEITSG